MMQLIENVAESIERVITHVFPLDKVQEALEVQSTRMCGKVMLEV